MKYLMTIVIGLVCLCHVSAQTTPCSQGVRNMYGQCIEITADCEAVTTSSGDIQFVMNGFSTDVSDKELVHKEVHFYIGGNFNNNCFTLDSLFMDFNDGQGEQLINQMGTPIIHQYSTVGYKTVNFRMVYDMGGGWISETASATFRIKENNLNGTTYQYTPPDTIWQIESPMFTPPCSNAYPTSNPYSQPNKGYANAYIKYADPTDKTLRNPVIFVDGFDFLQTAFFDPNIPGESYYQIWNYGMGCIVARVDKRNKCSDI